MKRKSKIKAADGLSEKKQRVKGKIEEESEASRKDWDRYFDDVEKSECFEVGDYPHMDLSSVHGFPVVCRIYDSSHKDENLEDDMLLYLSKLAICFHNIREGTNFGHVKVIMAMRSGIKNENRYVTFEAFPSNSKRKRVAVTFQTHILVNPSRPYPQVEIMFVRIKPSEQDQNNSKNCQQEQPSESDPNKDQIHQQGQPSESDQDKDQIYQKRLSRVIGRYTIGSQVDSQYSLALYLSHYALLNYNLFTLSESIAKHDIESLKVVKLMKPNAEVPTYNITFEAPLRGKTKRKNVETFKTEICMPLLFPTTVIQFKSVSKWLQADMNVSEVKVLDFWEEYDM